MSNANEKQPTRKDVEDQLTQANMNKRFEEFPKCLYHPDGRSIEVASRAEQDAQGEEFFESPQKAIDEKVRRDTRESEKFVAAVNAEAAAEQAAKDELFALVLGDPSGAAAKAYPQIDATGKSASQVLAELKAAVGGETKKPKK